MRNIPDGRRGVREQAERLREVVLDLGRRRSLRDPFASACEEMQLTPVQIHSVFWLGHDGPLAMGELARRVGTTEKTLTGIVDRLEREGYLHRERDVADRRLVRVRLARRGVEAHRRIDTLVNDKVARLLALLDAPERRALFRIVEKLHDRLLSAPAMVRSGRSNPKEDA